MVIRQNDLRLINWKQLMYLFGILKIALGVPESTEGFRFGTGLLVEIPAPLPASRVWVNTGGKDADRAYWALRRRGRGEKLDEGFFWGGLNGYMRAGLPWIKPLLCFAVICDIMQGKIWGGKRGESAEERSKGFSSVLWFIKIVSLALLEQSWVNKPAWDALFWEMGRLLLLMVACNPSKSILFLFFLLFLAKQMFWDSISAKGSTLGWWCLLILCALYLGLEQSSPWFPISGEFLRTRKIAKIK